MSLRALQDTIKIPPDYGTLAPGPFAVYQVNVQVPPDAPIGMYPLANTIGTVSSAVIRRSSESICFWR
jgi:uncharacterized protein (TIGR03437 family)